jgi:transcriptional regulator with XRE-family HTH domain
LSGPKPPPAGYPTEMRSLGDRLRRYRMDRALTQAALARELGVDPWTLLNWEHERCRPSRVHQARVDAVLGLALPGKGAELTFVRRP